MSHRPANAPPRRTRLDQLAYALCAVVVAVVAVLNVLAGCDPSPTRDARSIDGRASGPAR